MRTITPFRKTGRRKREHEGRGYRASKQEYRDAPVRWRHHDTDVAEIGPGARDRIDRDSEREAGNAEREHS